MLILDIENSMSRKTWDTWDRRDTTIEMRPNRNARSLTPPRFSAPSRPLPETECRDAALHVPERRYSSDPSKRVCVRAGVGRSMVYPQARTFQGLKALSSSIPSIANATDGKCREITDFIEFSSTQSIPSFV